MAAYIHGNLAVEEKSTQRAKVRESRKTVVRKKALPVQEKLLYLFTMAMCVAVACLILWRYAQIYEVNTKIQSLQDQMTQLENENKLLKVEVLKLEDPDRLMDEAKALGMAAPSEDGIKDISPLATSPTAGDGDKQVALKQ